MEKIRQAVELARGTDGENIKPRVQIEPVTVQGSVSTRADGASSGRAISLNGSHLEANRIISHDIADPRSKAFDILRTQVLQSMDMKNWQLLGITSPKAGCGKSVTAINLALSIARQPDRSVLLVDFDLQKPQIASYLGFRANNGLLSVLEGRSSLSDAIVEAQIKNQKLLVLPCEVGTLRSSELMASRSMSTVLQDIKREFRNYTVILDMAPLLTSDDVITILPQIDCVLFVTGAGISTAQEIKESAKHLETTPIVRIVLAKTAESNATYYSRTN
jgi:protein-tyrosine kinase